MMNNQAEDKLLDAWLSLTSTLWNTRIVQSMTFNEAHVMGLLLRFSTPSDPLTATDLIRRTHMLKSQMNKILTTLETKGFIVRLRSGIHPAYRRRKNRLSRRTHRR